MGRKKITDKNESVSISLSKLQVLYMLEHPEFNLSKFVQSALQGYIDGVDYIG